eukprot:m51a1_g8048 hypothetical protein (149) ;mRNA; r:96127-96862
MSAPQPYAPTAPSYSVPAPGAPQAPNGAMPPPPPAYNSAVPYAPAYPPPPAPAAIVAQPAETRVYESTPFVERVPVEEEKADTLAIVLFVLGWFISLCWLVGAFFLCSHKRANKRWGVASAVGFVAWAILVTVYWTVLYKPVDPNTPY